MAEEINVNCCQNENYDMWQKRYVNYLANKGKTVRKGAASLLTDSQWPGVNKWNTIRVHIPYWWTVRTQVVTTEPSSRTVMDGSQQVATQ